METLRVRTATTNDLRAINDIYNYYVLNSTCTYQLEPETPADREIWFAAHGPAHPITVAELAGRVVGWGSLSKYHPRAAYAKTVENSVYVHHEFQRRGIGSAILADLIERGRALGHRTIIASIDGEQTGSVELHARFGFAKVGHMRELGFKFGRWLDVVYMQLML
jgi:phosphinothricin acetyltransferase